MRRVWHMLTGATIGTALLLSSAGSALAWNGYNYPSNSGYGGYYGNLYPSTYYMPASAQYSGYVSPFTFSSGYYSLCNGQPCGGAFSPNSPCYAAICFGPPASSYYSYSPDTTYTY